MADINERVIRFVLKYSSASGAGVVGVEVEMELGVVVGGVEVGHRYRVGGDWSRGSSEGC